MLVFVQALVTCLLLVQVLVCFQHTLVLPPLHKACCLVVVITETLSIRPMIALTIGALAHGLQDIAERMEPTLQNQKQPKEWSLRDIRV